MIQFLENVWTVGQTDRRTDRAYFIGSLQLLPGFQKVHKWRHTLRNLHCYMIDTQLQGKQFKYYLLDYTDSGD